MNSDQKDFEDFFNGISQARETIVSLGYKKGNGGTGKIKCPKCNGILIFSVSGYNGHIHGRCETEDCLCWME